MAFKVQRWGMMAVAMLMFYALVRDKLGLFSLGMTTMVLSHVTFQIPFVAIVVRSRLVEGAPRDPYDVLGLPRDAPRDAARKAWKALVRDTHPDVLQSRGVPPEAMKLAERRLQLINEAWREISAKAAA